MSKKKQESFANKSASFETDIVNLEDFKAFSAQVNITNGSAFSANITVQVSNDYLSNWIDIPSTTAAISGASDVQFYEITNSIAGYARLKIDILTGSADFNIDWVLKS